MQQVVQTDPHTGETVVNQIITVQDPLTGNPVQQMVMTGTPNVNHYLAVQTMSDNNNVLSCSSVGNTTTLTFSKIFFDPQETQRLTGKPNFTGSAAGIITAGQQPQQQIIQTKIDPKTGKATQVVSTLQATNNVITVQDPVTGQMKLVDSTNTSKTLGSNEGTITLDSKNCHL